MMNTKAEDVNIRWFEQNDIPSIIAIDNKISTPIAKDPSTLKTELQYYLSKPNSLCLVAEIQNQVVGFMIGAIHPWLFGINNSGWIEILGVDPAQSGKGLGKMLGEALFEEFRERGISTVHTAVNWTSGDLMEFFKTMGMTKSELVSLMKEL
ncbi:MAG: GNAT family N-acetyltransferase [Candidatus Kariarchaeaceae archaeon]